MTDSKQLAQDIHDGKTHATTDDINAILHLRKTLPTVTHDELQAERMRQQGAQTPSVTSILQHVSAQAAQNHLPSVQLVPAPAPTSDLTVADWLTGELPQLISGVQNVFTKQAEGGLSEAWRDTETLIATVSTAVATGLPLVHGTEAKALVVAVVLWLFNTYAAAVVGPIPAMVVRSALPFVVQFVYDHFVAPKLAALKK